ncbi:Unknown protein, partial [Striga hermonthica]
RIVCRFFKVHAGSRGETSVGCLLLISARFASLLQPMQNRDSSGAVHSQAGVFRCRKLELLGCRCSLQPRIGLASAVSKSRPRSLNTAVHAWFSSATENWSFDRWSRVVHLAAARIAAR